jgi:hypothetical protein
MRAGGAEADGAAGCAASASRWSATRAERARRRARRPSGAAVATDTCPAGWTCAAWCKLGRARGICKSVSKRKVLRVTGTHSVVQEEWRECGAAVRGWRYEVSMVCVSEEEEAVVDDTYMIVMNGRQG